MSLQSLVLNGVNFMTFVLKSSHPKGDIPVSKPPGHSLRVTWPEEWESWLDLQDGDWAEGPVLSWRAAYVSAPRAWPTAQKGRPAAGEKPASGEAGDSV